MYLSKNNFVVSWRFCAKHSSQSAKSLMNKCYVIEKVDCKAQRSWTRIEVKNQDGKLVAVGTHIKKYIR